MQAVLWRCPSVSMDTSRKLPELDGVIGSARRNGAGVRGLARGMASSLTALAEAGHSNTIDAVASSVFSEVRTHASSGAARV